MDFDEYLRAVNIHLVNPTDDVHTPAYVALGLCSEAGEVADVLRKKLFYGKPTPPEELEKELGDVLWYVAALSSELDVTLQDVADANLQKLADRASRGTLQGNGDNR